VKKTGNKRGDKKYDVIDRLSKHQRSFCASVCVTSPLGEGAKAYRGGPLRCFSDLRTNKPSKHAESLCKQTLEVLAKPCFALWRIK
jgi:hypothetical protein